MKTSCSCSGSVAEREKDARETLVRNAPSSEMREPPRIGDQRRGVRGSDPRDDRLLVESSGGRRGPGARGDGDGVFVVPSAAASLGALLSDSDRDTNFIFFRFDLGVLGVDGVVGGTGGRSSGSGSTKPASRGGRGTWRDAAAAGGSKLA